MAVARTLKFYSKLYGRPLEGFKYDEICLLKTLPWVLSGECIEGAKLEAVRPIR